MALELTFFSQGQWDLLKNSLDLIESGWNIWHAWTKCDTQHQGKVLLGLDLCLELVLEITKQNHSMEPKWREAMLMLGNKNTEYPISLFPDVPKNHL